MSNLRWILLFAGFAILLLLYFSGRPRKVRRSKAGAGSVNQPSNAVAGAGHLPSELDVKTGAGTHSGALDHDPLMEPRDNTSFAQQEEVDFFSTAEFHEDDFVRPGSGDYSLSPNPAHNPAHNPNHSGTYVQPEAMQAEYSQVNYQPDHYPADQYAAEYGQRGPVNHGAQAMSAAPNAPQPGESMAPAHQSAYPPAHQVTGHAMAQPTTQAPPPAPSPTPAPVTSLGGKLNAIGARLLRSKKPAINGAIEEPVEQPVKQKVILLHVVAPEEQLIDGQLLLQVFEQRRYHFGEMDIFHALHHDQTIFSIAKMVEPGSFDVDDINSFQTPGLVLILRFPGPLAPDEAFNVLVNEANELADALGCRVLDSKRSTLSRQTIQHLRDDIRTYMHKQKYLKKPH